MQINMRRWQWTTAKKCHKYFNPNSRLMLGRSRGRRVGSETLIEPICGFDPGTVTRACISVVHACSFCSLITPYFLQLKYTHTAHTHTARLSRRCSHQLSTGSPHLPTYL